MNMYGTGMSPYMLNHFFKVAQDMNNYVAISSYNYYQNQYLQTIRDQGNFITLYEKPSLLMSGLGGLLSYGLHTIGMPPMIVNLGYRFGYFIDVHA